MKAKILTIHFGVNYGSCLQAYALSKTIEKLGVNCEVIDYVPKRYNSWVLYGRKKVGVYPFPIILAWYLLTMPEREYQRFIFRRFLKNNVSLTPKYTSPDEIIRKVPIADVYIAGSDQIWNYDYNTTGDFTYFFDFLRNGEKKVSYAASIGKTWLKEEEKVYFQKYLHDFRKITVREKSAKEMLNECGIESTVVLDPTFLLGKDEWLDFALPMSGGENYILVYVMDNLYKKLIDIANVLKEKYRLKIYAVTFKATKDKRVDREFRYLDPRKFITLIDGANYVVTNSFHGTAFSINLNKQFVSVGKGDYNSRIVDLLEMVGLKDRFIAEKENIDTVKHLKTIDYDCVNEKLECCRRESCGILRDFFK